MGGFASAGLLVGLGKGLENGVSTVFRARKEQREQQRLDQQEAHQQARERQADQREVDANTRAKTAADQIRFNNRLQFTEKGGVIKPLNGTEHIGFQIGASTASTQPSEYDDYDKVGEFEGESYMLPKDRLSPAERMKQQARQGRSSSLANLPFYKAPQSELDLASDPEQGDNITQGILTENRFRDPAHIRAAANSAGAIAGARYPFSATANKADPADPNRPMTRAQHLANTRTAIATARADERGSHAEAKALKDPKKSDFGYDPNLHWQMAGSDSAGYEAARTKNFAERGGAMMEGAMHRYSADSATKALEHPEPSSTGSYNDKIKEVHDTYLKAHARAQSPADKVHLKEVYLDSQDEIRAEYGMPPVPRKGSRGTSF